MKTKIIPLFVLIALFVSCKRNYVETYIQVRLSYIETKKPVAFAPVILMREKYGRSDRRISRNTVLDTFYTDAKGQLEIYKDLSDKSEFKYTLFVAQGDSNANSKTSQVIVPGYPNFYRQSVNQSFPVKVFIVHNSVSAAENKCSVSWAGSEFMGCKYGYTNVNLEKAFDTSFYVQALNNHTLSFFINSQVRDSNNRVWYYTRTVKEPADIFNTTSITLLY